ncbi:threonine/serine ThrE exporter family protein [Flexivirga caeni]|uniref:Threonine/serine exporter family protein n=1 Tax=Flexivirga caeni TaxID=2294115 RepID=A0A3M9MGN0_9MICO|nr:threonine/serine exporter family protein [Flexivirga caeni]RNI23818.1 threonine/serine exporter family protein [Flexivirga caeni]
MTEEVPDTDPGGLPLSGRMRFLQGEPVTEPLPLADTLRNTPYRDPRAMEAPGQEASVRGALELAVRVGELLLRCGASTRDVEAAVVAVAAAAGLRRLEVDITNQSLLVQAPTPSGVPVTWLRVVRSNTRDFARLTAVHRLVEDLVSGGIDDVAAATKKLRRIQRKSRIYPRWMVGLGYAGLAGSVCAVLGGHTMAIVVSIVSVLLVDRVGRWLSKHAVPSFYSSAAGGAISVVLAWFGYLIGIHGWLGIYMPPTEFGYAIAAGIVVLLPGRAMASAVEDAVTGYPVTGAGRLLTVFLATSGIIVGIAAGLSLTLRLDKALDLQLTALPLTGAHTTATAQLALDFASQPAALWLQVVCGAFGAICSAVSARVLPKHLLPAGLLGAIGLLLSGGLPSKVSIGGFHFGATTSIAIAAIVIGLAGRFIGLRLGAPALVLVVPAVSPLLPGLRIFRGMYDAVSGSVIGTSVATQGEALSTLMGAAAIALAISTGVVLGDAMSAPLDRQALRRRRARHR